MIKYIPLALAAAIAVPAYSGPAVATRLGLEHRRRHVGDAQQALTRSREVCPGATNKSSDPTKVMAYVKREGEKDIAVERHEFTCADKVRGLGTQWIGTEGAMDAAKKDWMERVRYDYGELFLDMNNSKGLRLPLRTRVDRRDSGPGDVPLRDRRPAVQGHHGGHEGRGEVSDCSSSMRGRPVPSVRLRVFGGRKPYGQSERFLPTSLATSRRRPP